MKPHFSFVMLLALALMLFTCACGGSVVTKTVLQPTTITSPGNTVTDTIPGPTVTSTQTTSVTIPGPTFITTQTSTATLTATVTAPTMISIQTATIMVTAPGPTTTVIQTKTSIPTQGITYIVSITPASPGTLHFNEFVQITFDYVITDPGGARIWAIPLTGGKQTPNSGYTTPGLVPPGRGTVSIQFFVASGAVKIDQIQLLVRNSTQTADLFVAYIPVDYSYGP